MPETFSTVCLELMLGFFLADSAVFMEADAEPTCALHDRLKVALLLVEQRHRACVAATTCNALAGAASAVA